jgi:hypothetical protein
MLDAIIAALEHKLGRAAPPREASEEVTERDADLRAAMDTLDTSQEVLDVGDA